jgi:sec-independent protein translocase protein TatA
VRPGWHSQAPRAAPSGLRGVRALRGGRASLSRVGIENPVHILFIAAVALVVLGPKRLPELARAAGRSMREFREALNGGVVEEEPQVAQLVEPEREPE